MKAEMKKSCHPLSDFSCECHRCLGAGVPSAASTSGEAAAVLSGARDALGGEKRIAAIKTIVASGRTRQLQGDNLVPIEFEITIELPDKYVRTDEIPARESGPNSRGFNGDGLIQSGDAPGGPAAQRRPAPCRAAAPPAPLRRVRRGGRCGAASRRAPDATGGERGRGPAGRRRVRPFPSNRISPS